MFSILYWRGEWGRAAKSVEAYAKCSEKLSRHLLQEVSCIFSRCVCDTQAIFLVSCSLIYHTATLGKINKTKPIDNNNKTQTQQLLYNWESLPRVIKSCFSLCFRISFLEVLSNLEWAWKCYNVSIVFSIYFETQNGIWRQISMATCIKSH